MTPIMIARIILTLLLVVGTGASFVLDWSANHLLHPGWPPHARFHGALLLFFLAGTSGTALWLLWRKSSEPLVAIQASALIAASFWTPLFYVASVLPGASGWAGVPGAEPRYGGVVVLPNLVVAAVFLVAAAAACVVARVRQPGLR